jgi:hypothetical protein
MDPEGCPLQVSNVIAKKLGKVYHFMNKTLILSIFTNI